MRAQTLTQTHTPTGTKLIVIQYRIEHYIYKILTRISIYSITMKCPKREQRVIKYKSYYLWNR